MSKFKVGDKVKCVVGVDCFTANHGADYGVVSFVNSNGTFIKIDGHTIKWSVGMFELVQDEWSVYNNDKPFYELTDEQRGMLFNHHFHGGDIDYNDTIGWSSSEFPEWGMHTTYRAKQKSERELFIEAARKLTEHDNGTLLLTSFLGRMFDVGYKAPKVGE